MQAPNNCLEEREPGKNQHKAIRGKKPTSCTDRGVQSTSSILAPGERLQVWWKQRGQRHFLLPRMSPASWNWIELNQVKINTWEKSRKVVVISSRGGEMCPQTWSDPQPLPLILESSSSLTYVCLFPELISNQQGKGLRMPGSRDQK